jgi:VanZ family protein
MAMTCKILDVKIGKSLFLSWLLVLAWMSFIFYLSSQPAPVSNSLSKKVAKTVIEGVDKVEGRDAKAYKLNKVNNLTRDYAHGGVFGVLSILALSALRKSGFKSRAAYLTAFLICACYACTDEFHQIFVSGRGAEFQDWLKDCLGTIFGLGLYFFVAAFDKWS